VEGIALRVGQLAGRVFIKANSTLRRIGSMRFTLSGLREGSAQSEEL
jgi:hypothetical protein